MVDEPAATSLSSSLCPSALNSCNRSASSCALDRNRGGAWVRVWVRVRVWVWVRVWVRVYLQTTQHQ